MFSPTVSESDGMCNLAHASTFPVHPSSPFPLSSSTRAKCQHTTSMIRSHHP